jgi:hypothetical protein
MTSSSKKSNKTSRKTKSKSQKSRKNSSKKMKTNSMPNLVKTNMDGIFKGSMQRKLMKRFLEENKNKNIIANFPCVEITCAIFAEFNKINMKLINSVTNDPSVFFTNTKNSVGKYYKDIQEVDLYFTSIICACAYKNDVLIGLIVTMLNDSNIDGNMVRNILNTLLAGYVPKNDIVYGGADWKKVIFSLILISNVLYFLLQCNYLYSSTKNLMKEMKNGKTMQTLNTLKEIADNSNILKKCISYNEVNPKSKKQELFKMIFSGLGNNVYQQFSNINSVYNCFEHPEITRELSEESVYVTNINSQTDDVIHVEQSIVENPTYPIMEFNQGSITSVDINVPIAAEIMMDVQLDALNETQQARMLEGLQNIVKVVKTKLTYKEALEYFDDLAEPDNDEIAKQLLTNDDFVLYKIHEDERKKKFQDMYKINIKDTTFIGRTAVIVGAIKELLWDTPSYTPFLDMINHIRENINKYTRMIRDKYNAYNDLIHDVSYELEHLNKKIEIANKQILNIFISGAALTTEILGISYYNLVMKRRANRRAITDSNLLE